MIRPLLFLALLTLALPASAQAPASSGPSTAEATAPSTGAPVAAAAQTQPADATATAPASDPLLVNEEPRQVPEPLSFADTFWPFVKMTLMLLVVLGLVYLTLHKGLGSLMARGQDGKRMRVVERISLGERKALFLVEVDGREMLLGTGEHGVAHLVDLSAPAAFSQTLQKFEQAPAKAPPISGPQPSLPDDDEGAAA